MSKVAVSQTITVLELNDKETPAGTRPALGIDSHWNISDWVVLHYGKLVITVEGQALITAIHNAMNTGSL